MPQPVWQEPEWQTVPDPQLLACASLALLQAVTLVAGWQDWQAPLAAPEA